jgi:hypothetical protein
MREWIYGHGDPEGHESEYLERYVRHREDVMGYFAGREEKAFMVLRIMEGEGWDKICTFLGLPVPRDLPFPHLNRTDNA